MAAATQDPARSIEYAQAFAAWGVGTVEVYEHQKRPVGDDWQLGATTSLPVIAQRINKRGGQYGLKVRPESRALGIDVDEPGFPMDTLPAGAVIVSRGHEFKRHAWVRLPEGVDPETVPARHRWGETATVAQRQLVGPGSIHPDGSLYEVTSGPLPDELPALDPFVYELLFVDPFSGNGTKPGEFTWTARGPRDDEDWTWDPSMGSRHDLLVRKVRHWRGTGLDRETVTAQVWAFMERHQVPRAHNGRTITPAEVGAIVAGAFAKFREDPPEPQDAPAVALPPFRRAMEVLEEFRGQEDPWMVDGLMRPGRYGVLAAYEGEGKSWVRLQVGLECVVGVPVLGMFPVPEPLAVVTIDMENGDREEARRDLATLEALGLDPKDVGPYLHRLTLDQALLSLDKPAHVAHIGAGVDQVHAETGRGVVLFLDSADSLHQGPTWGSDLAEMMDNLRGLRAGRPWLFTWLVAHLNKRGMAARMAKVKRSMEDVTGNLTRQADVSVVLETTGTDTMRMEVRKRVPRRTAELARTAGLWGLAEEVEETASPSTKMPDSAVMEWMRGRMRTTARDAVEEFGVSYNTAKRVMDALVDAGLLASSVNLPGFSKATEYWLPDQDHHDPAPRSSSNP